MEGLARKGNPLLRMRCLHAAMQQPIVIYVDADACPVKDEVYRVAGRHGLKVGVVSNSAVAVPREKLDRARGGRRAWTPPTTGSPNARGRAPS